MDIVTLAAARKYTDKKVVESVGVVIDSTLSQAGQAADSAAVGEAIESIKESVSPPEAMTTEDIDKAIADGGD